MVSDAESSATPATAAHGNVSLDDGQALILYYSFTGNTETLARLVHRETGLPLVAIERPQAFMLDPDDDGPEPLEVEEADLAACRTIILGFPVWTNQLPSGLVAWLEDNKLEGKTILPFCTHSGNGPGNTFDELKTLCPDSEIREGLALIGGVEEDGVLMPLEDEQLEAAGTQIRAWLQQTASAAPDSAEGAAQADPAPANQVPFVTAAGHKAVVVFFSQHGNTEAAAWLIQKLIDIEVVQLKPVQLYPRDYKSAFEQVKIENELGYLPKFSTLDADLSDIDHVFVGFPAWDEQLPPPVKSWLSRTDWTGKTILPFATHAGGGAARGFAQLAALCPTAKVTPGLALEGGATRDNCALAIRGRRMAQVERELSAWLAEVRR